MNEGWVYLSLRGMDEVWIYLSLGGIDKGRKVMAFKEVMGLCDFVPWIGNDIMISCSISCLIPCCYLPNRFDVEKVNQESHCE
jgi:hypothetical protein